MRDNGRGLRYAAGFALLGALAAGDNPPALRATPF